jgi:hypothetical protein
MSEDNKKQPNCLDFLGAFNVCQGEHVIIKVAKDTFIGKILEVKDWGIVLLDKYGRPLVVRNRYVEYIIKLPEDKEDDNNAESDAKGTA